MSAPAEPPTALRRLGEPPATTRDHADEAELDTLRGELVRELDRMAKGEPPTSPASPASRPGS